ncbi:coiled-coil domain-containing protein [Frigoribacterium salinisoli]
MVATLGVVVLGVTGCTADPPLEDPSRVLQTVETSLSTDGAVTGVTSTTISVDDTAARTSTASTDHEPSEVADDLPVRVTTQWRAGDASGTDLADLEGRDGRVEIDLTVENLTVAPRSLDYDVAGRSRTDAALVGAPLSVAASTVLAGTSPSAVVTSASDAGGGTDGIVSTNGDGDAVVQWGRLLAPPTSGASTTLRLVVDAEQFTAPSFDLAVQPGLSTDLSVDGVLASAFDEGPTSELALQQRTITLVTDVAAVLGRAGGTITEVRTNLETTSETLGVRTAEQLRDSSSSLASTMQGVSGQLAALEGDLGGTVTGTQQTVRGQLQQTVASVDALLGDTSATAPSVAVDGEGCAAVVAAPGETASVYGSLLQVSAQLDAYASTNAECRDQVVAELQRVLGPETPDATVCASDSSLTCSLFQSSASILGVLAELAEQGEKLSTSLEPDLAQTALDSYDELAASVASLEAQLAALDEDPSGDAVGDALDELRAAVGAAQRRVPALRDRVDGLHDDAIEARDAIGDVEEPVSSSMQAQNARLADELCDLRDVPGLSVLQVERLRSFLVDTSCGRAAEPVEPEVPGTPEDPADPQAPGTPEETAAPTAGLPLPPPLPFLRPMEDRLAEQAAAWDLVIAVTDTDVTEGDGLGAAIASLDAEVTAVDAALASLEEAVAAGDVSLGGALQRLRETTDAASASGVGLREDLDALKVQQEALAAQVAEAFDSAAGTAAEDVVLSTGKQVERVTAQATTSREAVSDAFARSVAGLSTTSGSVTAEARRTIESQRGDLGEQTDALTAAVDGQAATTLERIAATTSASTRDVEGARTLLSADLAKVLLDLGDPEVNGSGLLGSMTTSAAKADTADYQLALASQEASGYANVRAEDVAGIMLRRAQVTASLEAAGALPAFHLDVPAGATSTTLYSFRIGGTR